MPRSRTHTSGCSWWTPCSVLFTTRAVHLSSSLMKCTVSEGWMSTTMSPLCCMQAGFTSTEQSLTLPSSYLSSTTTVSAMHVGLRTFGNAGLRRWRATPVCISTHRTLLDGFGLMGARGGRIMPPIMATSPSGVVWGIGTSVSHDAGKYGFSWLWAWREIRKVCWLWYRNVNLCSFSILPHAKYYIFWCLITMKQIA